MNPYSFLVIMATLFACKPKSVSTEEPVKGTAGYNIEILDPIVKSIIDDKATPKVIASGFNWAEGPLWLPSQNALLFSDVPENKIYRWSQQDGVTIYLDSAGYTGPAEFPAEGSNGLFLNDQGQLVICQHGDRRVAVMDAPLSDPQPKFITLANKWRGNRFNSPNDGAFYKGELFLTDPPYGLPGKDKDSLKELSFNGVYRVGQKGVVIKIIDDLKRPNGIAFNPRTNMMYISNSDPDRAIWMKYDMGDPNNPYPHLLYNATKIAGTVSGLPDGLKVHPKGYVFATGPGGIWVFSEEDKLVAKIHIPQETSNCAFDDTFSNLYVTADSTVIQIPLIPAK